MARPCDPAVRVGHDFLVVGDPAGHAADGEHHGEHVQRDADGAHDDAAVEIDIRIEFSGNEIIVVQGDVLEFFGDVQQGVGLVELGEHLVALLFEDDGAGIEVFVYAVAEAHQAAMGGLIFDLVEELGAVVAILMDFLKHFEHGLVRAAVERPPQGADAGRGGGEEVGAAGGDHADGRGRAVLLVIGMKQEDEIEGLDDFRFELAVLAGWGENIM